MKLITKIIFLFILAIIIAVLCNYGPGHVILFIGKYRVDFSLATLVLIIVILYIVVHFISALSDSIYHIPYTIKQYRQKRFLIKSRSYFNYAATNYFLGEYKSAYNNALKSISQNISVSDKFPVLLLAIDSIHLMDDTDKKQSIRLTRLVNKLAGNEERLYIYNELNKINQVKNNRFYSEVLAQLAPNNQSIAEGSA